MEIDEFQHKHYNKEKEINRINNFIDDVYKNKLIIIRFNPDGFFTFKHYINSYSCWIENKIIDSNKINEWSFRIDKLNEKIQFWLNNIPNELLTIEKLFFDEA